MLGSLLRAEETEHGADVAELLRRARAGDVAAQLEVTEHFLINSTADTDDAPERDFKQVERWLEAAALKGSAPASRMLGELLICEYPGIPVDPERAFAAFEKAALGGDLRAMLEMGHLHENGTGTPKDPAKAEAWWQKAVAQAPEGSRERDQAAMMLVRLADMRETADVAADAEGADEEAAAAGPDAGSDAAVLYQRALAFGQGDEVPRDLEQAAQCLIAAAALGHADAQRKLAMFDFYPGMGRLAVMARIRTQEGLAELTAAAGQGDAEAQFALGLHALVSDPAVKVGWFAKAAAQHHRVAMYWLGRAYEIGEGVPVDQVKSLAWYAQAAQLGDRGAMAKIAEFYNWGYTGLKSPALAKYWNQQAAVGAPAGDSTAKYATDSANAIKEPAAEAEYARKLLRQAAAGAVFPGGTKLVASAPATPPAPPPAPAATPAAPTPEQLLAAAEKGDAGAMYQLGLADLERRRVWSDKLNGVIPMDRQRDANDFRWIMAAARAGHPEAQFLAATHWLSAESDADKKAWLEKATAQGHAGAKEKLAALAKAADAAVAEAAEAAKQAAADRQLVAQGDPDAAYRLFRARMKEVVATILADFSAEQNGQPTSGKNYKLGYLDAEMIAWGDTITNRLHPDGLVMLHDYLRDDRPDFAYRALLLRERIAETDLRLQLPDGGSGTKSRAGFEKALAHLRGKLTADQRAQVEKMAADQFGGPWVENVIGANFEGGVCGYPTDYGLAAAHYRRAAEAGYAPAQCNLGRCYYLGLGVPQDTAQARVWYAKSAAQGDATAQAQIRQLDTLTPMARIKALSAEERARLTDDEWVAAEALVLNAVQREKLFAGDTATMLTVARNYRDGVDGFVRDYGRAYVWFSEAAEKGSADAEAEIGNCHALGQGRPEDPVVAFQHYLRAAERGSALGQLNVGFSYLNGDGVASDPLAAHEWLTKAAAQGQAAAQKLVKELSQDADFQASLAQRRQTQAGQQSSSATAAPSAPVYDPIKDNPILQQGALATRALEGDQAAAAELERQQAQLGAQRDLVNGATPSSAAPAPPVAPALDGRVSDLNLNAFEALKLIKESNKGSFNEANALVLKQGILKGDGTVDDAERDLLVEMTQSQFRNIRVRPVGAQADGPEIMVFPTVGRAKAVLLGVLHSKPDFEAAWTQGSEGFRALCLYTKETPAAEAEVLDFVAKKLANEWELSNTANGFKPLRDLIGRLYGYANSLGADTELGRSIIYRSMEKIDRASEGAVPDFLYDWLRSAGNP